jgi:uncharacterized cupredoxin-like copper-binding protein
MTSAELVSKMTNPWTFKFYCLQKLPSLAFWGVKVNSLDAKGAVTSAKYKWTNTNPFKSMYFSALCGAAELSTGLPFMYHMMEKGQFSYLVVGFSSKFNKKAVGNIQFKCEDGDKIGAMINSLASKPGNSDTITVTAKAINESNEVVAEFEVLWSIKYKGI